MSGPLSSIRRQQPNERFTLVSNITVLTKAQPYPVELQFGDDRLQHWLRSATGRRFMRPCSNAECPRETYTAWRAPPYGGLSLNERAGNTRSVQKTGFSAIYRFHASCRYTECLFLSTDRRTMWDIGSTECEFPLRSRLDRRKQVVICIECNHPFQIRRTFPETKSRMTALVQRSVPAASEQTQRMLSLFSTLERKLAISNTPLITNATIPTGRTTPTNSDIRTIPAKPLIAVEHTAHRPIRKIKPIPWRHRLICEPQKKRTSVSVASRRSRVAGRNPESSSCFGEIISVTICK